MAGTSDVVSRLKQPEYTGPNRCIPCTFVNSIIALLLATAIGAAVTASTALLWGTASALVVIAVSGSLIYFRGYLVPGTPTITKRYFPNRLLGLFGKDSTNDDPQRAESDLDPETVLTGIGALEPCADGKDLCLTDEFRGVWYEEIDRVRERDAEREQLLGLLDIDEGEVAYEEYGSAFKASVDGYMVGQWESRAAFLADLGAATVLADRLDDWPSHSMAAKSALLNGLRLFIDTCPSCGGVPQFGTETVESCCSTNEVAAVSCQECGARLFESQPID